MLYPKNNEPLSSDLFKNPTCEYRGAPFWAWNTKLEKEELLWQTEQLKKLGFGGYHIHVRTGLATEYLGDEFMDMVKACVDKAQGEDMLSWLYDEDRWPSGAAGGYVTKNPAYRMRHLLLTRHPYSEFGKGQDVIISSAAAGRTGNGRLLACYDVRLNENGVLDSYCRIGENDAAKGIKLYAYEETALPSPWYNNQTYADTLNPDAIREFIRITYERYYEIVGKSFGAVTPAIFTDEPQFSHKSTLEYTHQDKDVTLPWTGDLPETYQASYAGEDLLNSIPELLWELPNGKASVVRYHYHDHIAERFSAAFADQCGKWCGDHKIMLTGHMMEEPTLYSQTAALGEAMRSYRSFQLPGIDMLSDSREYTTAKQAQSAARQFGCPGVMSELYGVTNWDFDFRGHKLQGDWQAVLGVTVRVPHLSWVSMNGEAKRDYPSTFNYQSPWYEEYPYIENHFARVNTAMTRGRPICLIGVIHPIESYWLHWGAKEATQAIRQQMDDHFQNLTEWLLRSMHDFDFISESLLPEQCSISDITNEEFPVGKMAYKVILVPPVETLRSTTLERLEIFQNAGGRLIFLGSAPTLCDAYENDRGRKLWERTEHVNFNCTAIAEALQSFREIEIREAGGAPVSHLFYQLREDESGRWVFIASADKPVNQDIPPTKLPKYQIKLRGEYDISIYDTISGEIHEADGQIQNGWTALTCLLYEHDSLLLRLTPSAKNLKILEKPPITKIVGKSYFQSPVPITLCEPNVLLLDLAEYALDDGMWRPKDEILRLDNVLRTELGWPLRMEAIAQPWCATNNDTPHTLRLRFSFQSKVKVTGAMFAMENAVNATVTLNGQKSGSVMGWYVDKCIGKMSLPDIQQGENDIEVSFPYGSKVDVESCYLLGDFGVEVKGCQCILTEPVRELSFGDITRQGLPFYGGNLIYHMEIETVGNALEIEASYYRSHLLRASVDEKDVGLIAFSPYKIVVEDILPGKHRVDLTCFGTRVNTFGQLHRNDRYNQWWGPDSWRTTGPSWTWEYRFWEQGVLKSPEIYDREDNINASIKSM